VGSIVVLVFLLLLPLRNSLVLVDLGWVGRTMFLNLEVGEVDHHKLVERGIRQLISLSSLVDELYYARHLCFQLPY